MLRALGLLFVQIVATFAVFDVGLRIYWAQTLPDKLFQGLAPLMTIGPNMRVADPHSGYRYGPNQEASIGAPWFSHWKTNSHGHVSSEEYPVEKPSDEFRIAVVGDSFTANITSNVRWPEELQKLLNASPAWRGRVDGKFTRVINFGIDGTGIAQYAGVVGHHVGPFNPDLIIVNFMSDDFLRPKRFVLRAPASRDRAARDLVNEIVRGVNWLEPCSTWLSAIGWRGRAACRNIPFDVPRFFAEKSRIDLRYSTIEEATEQNVVALRAMMAVPNVLFLQQPTLEELEAGYIPLEWTAARTSAENAVPEWRSTSMHSELSKLLEGKRTVDRPELLSFNVHQIAALPDDQKPELYRWFYIPYDSHYTDYGNIVYSGVVERFLTEHYVRGGTVGLRAATPQPTKQE